MRFYKIAFIMAFASVWAAGADAQYTKYPLIIENCGQEVVFKSAPQRVVTVGQSTTEMLYALGLSDRVLGTSVWFNEVLPDFKDANSKVERLADNHPSFESVIAKKPDLVTTQFEVHVGPQGVVGTREQFNDLGINVYAMPADCVGKDNKVGGDGARKTAFDIATVYQAIDELAAIFDVADRGTELKAKLQGKIGAAIEKAKSARRKNVSAVFWFSSPEVELDPFVAGQKGIPGYIMKTLGIRNVIESDEEWPSVGWETIAKANPDIIVLARMDRRRFEADDYQVRLNFLKTDPVAREMNAVKNNRIVIVDAHAIHAGIRIPDGIEAIADALSKVD
ncbi:ABC transporter substrate-binding protein [Brucella pseudintermedia]|uniref:ABC transporter substrate-binding protein n=1 Tax=Brucella pseudintermedia TaxID=370111 RepID=A0ABY5UEJ1_9HYPH|nr:ABC transporter substrate-binding protein [Brucella pseudintermedia]UWL61764.1 ABC transporter substrate-binding protein [Brucella pseudintermedia]